MKVKQVLPFFCVLLLFICSCDSVIDEYPNDPNNNLIPEVPPRQYWAYNHMISKYYGITADLHYDGEHCRIWVDRGVKISASTVKHIADTFDNNIYPKLMDTFGTYGNMTLDGTSIARNTMELADWLGDGDGKLTILFLDVQDDYQPGVYESRVTGYFSSDDLLDKQYSNKTDMIYIDANPEKPGSEESFKTIAHETQHLINYVTGFLYRRDNNGNVHEMDTWINEGLSAIAEWVYNEEYSESRWAYYSADPSGLIRNGNNFYIWGNHKNEHQYYELDDYSTVYLFFHWMRLQTGGNDVFFDIISSDDYNYRAVTRAVENAISGAGYNDWRILLRTWLAANYINAPTGPYGYQNDRTLRRIRANTIQAGTENILLYPGEGVYSLTKLGFSWPTEGYNIKYAGLTSRFPWVNDNGGYVGGALLTYNANPDNRGGPEEGRTSGIAANVDMTYFEERVRSLLSERIVIDIGSMLRQDRQSEKPRQAVTGSIRGIINIE